MRPKVIGMKVTIFSETVTKMVFSEMVTKTVTIFGLDMLPWVQFAYQLVLLAVIIYLTDLRPPQLRGSQEERDWILLSAAFSALR